MTHQINQNDSTNLLIKTLSDSNTKLQNKIYLIKSQLEEICDKNTIDINSIKDILKDL